MHCVCLSTDDIQYLQSLHFTHFCQHGKDSAQKYARHLTTFFIYIFVTMSSAKSTKGLKRGPKDGGTRNEISKDSWYAACVLKNSSDTLKRMSIGLFLKSNLSGEQFTGTKSQQVLFAKYLKKYENGELRPLTKKRVRQSKYVALEEKLVKYIRLRQSLYHRDKCGLSWVVLEKKLADWAAIEEDETYNDFKASPCKDRLWKKSVRMKRASRACDTVD